MPHLEILQGPDQGRQFELGDAITIGRAPKNAFCLPDGRASREHAGIREENGRFLIEDLNSANGTYVNGVRLAPGTPQPLHHGDEIAIGGSCLAYRDKTETGTGTLDSNPNLSVVVTGDENGGPPVNLTIDASQSMVEIRDEEKGSEQGLMEALKRLQAMVKVSADLGTVTGIRALLRRIMESIFEIFPQADRAFILLRDKQTGEMVPAVGRHRREIPGQQDEFPISNTIIRAVTQNKQSVLSSDAQEDFGSQRSIVDLNIRSMMCVPFLTQDELLGVINVDIVSSARQFDKDDLAMLTGIAAQAAVAIKNAELYEAVEEETRKRSQLSRYMSPDVVEGVLDGSIPLELGGEAKRGTVFFCDIVGFTAMSEKLTPSEVIDKLNRYFGFTTEIVTRNKGTLHKFQGDMIMAFWNVLVPDARAEVNAIRTGLEMQAAVWSFDLALKNEGQAPIYLGIGCNTGEFVGGNLGGENTMEYTIIGDNVNLGQRIESMAGRWQVFVAKATYEAARDACAAVALPPVSVKGKSHPIPIYSVRGLADDSGGMLLDIPVRVLTPECELITHGLLTACSETDEQVELTLYAIDELAEGQAVALEFDTPEIKRSFLLYGSLRDVNASVEICGAVHTTATVVDVTGESDVLNFLRPGALLESRRTWEEMERR